MGPSGLQRATSSRSAADLLSLAHSMSCQTEEQHQALKRHAASAYDYAPVLLSQLPLQACVMLPPAVSQEPFVAAAGDTALGPFLSADPTADPLSRATRIESSASDASFV
jgi:hypothetical protein